jgi:hypothetical protein
MMSSCFWNKNFDVVRGPKVEERLDENGGGQDVVVAPQDDDEGERPAFRRIFMTEDACLTTLADGMSKNTTSWFRASLVRKQSNFRIVEIGNNGRKENCVVGQEETEVKGKTQQHYLRFSLSITSTPPAHCSFKALKAASALLLLSPSSRF